MSRFLFALLLLSTSAFAEYREVTGPEAQATINAVVQDAAADLYDRFTSCGTHTPGRMEVDYIKDHHLYTEVLYFDGTGDMMETRVYVDDVTGDTMIVQKWEPLRTNTLLVTYKDKKVTGVYVTIESDPKDSVTVDCHFG